MLRQTTFQILLFSAAILQGLCSLSLEATHITRAGFISRTTKTQKIKLYYELAGSGTQTIVLLHGFGAHSQIWKEHVQELSKEYQVLTCDLRGHGKSSKPYDGYSLDEFADDIHELLTQLSIEKPLMIGWSLGGQIALHHSLCYPKDNASLALVCTSPSFIAHDGFPFGATIQESEKTYVQLLNNPEAYYTECVNANFTELDPASTKRKKLEKMFLGMLRESNPKALAGITKYFIDQAPTLVTKLKQVSLPTLIIVGDCDEVLPPGASFTMYKEIPQAKISVFKNFGHSIPLTAQEEFIQVIKKFATTQNA